MTQFVNKASFAGTNGTELSALDSDFVKHSGTPDLIVVEDRLRPSGTGRVIYYHAADPASPDYSVSGSLYMVSSAASNFGICGRLSISAETYYRMDHNGVGWRIYKFIAGAATQIGSTFNQTLEAGGTYQFELSMVGDAIKGYVDGVERISGTDSSITAAGKAGITANPPGAPSDGAGQHLASFSAEDSGSDPGDTTAPTLTSPTGTATSSTTASGSVSTDEGNGTLYAVCTTSSTAPSAAQVQAGTDDSDAAAAYATSQAVGGTGEQDVAATGLTAEGTYYWHFQHKDAAGNDSAVVSSASFTTDADPGEAVAFSGTVPNVTPIVGSAYSLDLSGYFTGSATPFTYTVQAGTLPAGLSLSGPTITGTPTTLETKSGIVIRATDDNAATADTNEFSITVGLPATSGGVAIVSLIGF